MKLCFDIYRIVVGAVAASLVVNGVVTKNTFEQIGAPNHPIGKPVGMALFVLGWLLSAYVFGIGKSASLRFGAAGASLSILGAVMWMKEQMSKGEKPGMVAPAMFAIGWLALGLISAAGLPVWGQVLGVIAAALVLGSMMGTLPLQRKMGVVDGPGMPMFTMAWVLIVGLNALGR
jgi:hypothetical protein